MNRSNITSGAPWEDQVGYSRAVRIGNIVEVSGTAAVENGEIVGKGDAFIQAKQCLRIIARALEEAGADLEDVIRTRIYVTDISSWREIGRAHAECFRDIKPATSMVEVQSLIDPDMLVEIEASAVINR